MSFRDIRIPEGRAPGFLVCDFGGRPSGLPDCPFLKRCAFGGLRYPTCWRPSPPLSSAIARRFGESRRQYVIGRGSKFLPGSLQYCRSTGEFFVTPDDHVTIQRIELNQASCSTGAFGCDQGRSGAAKYIEHDPAAARAIQDRILDECDGFDGWVHFKFG